MNGSTTCSLPGRLKTMWAGWLATQAGSQPGGGS
jgi:hypothetical protein